jgi:salicylate hydroxylase
VSERAAARTVYIAGAGIAGLTLALALAKFGATVVLLERSRAVQELGAGLQISPNARRILNQLGLDRAIQQKAFEPRGIDVYPFRARTPLTTLRLAPAMADRFGAPYAVLHRADLAQILFRACRRFANIDMLFGVRAFDVATHVRGISVIVDEAPGAARSGAAFAFVGADGVNSHTRTAVMSGPEAKYSGAVAWRTTIPAVALEGVIAPDRVSLLFAPGYHAVCYPLPHRKAFNVALFAKEKEAVAYGLQPPKEPRLPWTMLRSDHFDGIMAAAAGAWGYWPMATVDTDQWHSGSIGLIGDAAHAMLPHQAQGAAMAIEDAAILAPLLMTEPRAESAFARYAAMRRKRVERVRRLSARNGMVFHMEWPFTWARDAVIALGGATGHLRRLAWLYGYDAVPEAQISAPPRMAREAHSR